MNNNNNLVKSVLENNSKNNHMLNYLNKNKSRFISFKIIINIIMNHKIIKKYQKISYFLDHHKKRMIFLSHFSNLELKLNQVSLLN